MHDPVYQVYPVNRITGEGRAEVLRACGAGFEQECGGGQLNLWAENITLLRGQT